MKHHTRQRQAIVQCLEKAEGPMSPREILVHARENVDSMGIATVYRNLRLLQEEGKVRELILPGEGARYEKKEHAHHHHFFCRGCDRVFCVEGCPREFSSMVPRGFVLEDHEIVLYGRCQDCLDRSIF
jgi:Fur family transcriptional regulator, ferric uptake regulator